MANFEEFRWNFSSSTILEIGRSGVSPTKTKIYEVGSYRKSISNLVFSEYIIIRKKNKFPKG